jgi:hypothetical protein
MRIATGHIVDGKLVVDREPLPEGVVVTILQPEAETEAFVLSSDDEEELLQSIRDIEEGRFVSGSNLLESLKRD